MSIRQIYLKAVIIILCCFAVYAQSNYDLEELAKLFEFDAQFAVYKDFYHYRDSRKGEPVISFIRKTENKNQAIVIISEADIYSLCHERIDRYIADIENNLQYTTIFYTVTKAVSPEDIKDILTGHYQVEGIEGAVLIGDVSTAWYEIDNDFNTYGYAVFPIDLFYMDLNGTWTDTDSNGRYDSHSGHVSPEIYVGRINTSTMHLLGSEEYLLNLYLDRNHQYWSGLVQLTEKKGLSYTDHDWTSFSYFRHDVQYIYGSSNYEWYIYGDGVFSRNDYLNRLENEVYGMVQFSCHSTWSAHYLHNEPLIYSQGIFNLPPQALSYNLFNCSGARWTAPTVNDYGYLGGAYVYNHSSNALFAVGSSKTGSMLGFSYYYIPLGNGKTNGQAFKDWWVNFVGPTHDFNEVCWFYGMTIVGDPMVSLFYEPDLSLGAPSGLFAEAVSSSQVSLSWISNSDDEEGFKIERRSGTSAWSEIGSTGPSVTAYSDTGLEASTLYCYRVRAYNAGGNSDYSNEDCAITLPDSVYTPPFTEDFDSSQNLPADWLIIDNQGNGQVWQIGTINDGLSGTTGNYAYLDSDGYGQGNTQDSDLITPALDLSDYSDISLTFTHYFRQYSDWSTAALYYSLDNGTTWSVISVWTASTGNPAVFSQSIPEAGGHSQVRFMWNYTGSWGYYWCIDDIMINGTGLTAYAVTLMTEPSGLDAVLSGGGEYSEGERVDISAGPADGYGFLHWTGDHAHLLDDISSSDTYFIMPSHDIALTAVYSPLHSEKIPAVISLDNPSFRGVWIWTYDTKGWTRLIEGISARKIMTGDITGDGNPEIVMDLPGYGLGYYIMDSGEWNSLMSDCIDFSLARASIEKPLQIVASFQEGLFIWDYDTKVWTRIISVPADIIVASDVLRDGWLDELVLTFSGYDGLYVYSFLSLSFERIIMASPSQIIAGDITGDGFDELACSFEGFGVYLVRNLARGNTVLLDKTEIDLAEDIPYNAVWVSNSKGWNFQRITWGNPDAGHYMATGDIAFDSSEELILTYQGKTYMYSYDNAWSTLLEAPLKRIISGKFTGNQKDDLIVCESMGKGVYLRNTQISAWELIAGEGDSDAMAALK